MIISGVVIEVPSITSITPKSLQVEPIYELSNPHELSVKKCVHNCNLNITTRLGRTHCVSPED